MEFIKNVIRGITIGIANVVPGVSGGTIMVSLGIYDELLQAVTGFFRHKKESILKLFPYLFGMGIGIICLSFMIGYLFENFPIWMAARSTSKMEAGSSPASQARSRCCAFSARCRMQPRRRTSAPDTSSSLICRVEKRRISHSIPCLATL